MKRRYPAFIAIAVLAALVLWLTAENRRLHAQLEASARAMASVKPVSPAIATARSDPASPTQPAHAAAIPIPSPPPPSSASLWADPQWRAAQFNQAYLQAEVRHARFFQRLKNWPPERLEALKRQFADQSLALMQAATTAPTNGGDVGAELDRVRAAGDAELKATLTDDEYRSFQETEAMETSQQSLSPLLDTMRSRGITLDSNQEEAALRVYANVLHDAATRASGTPISGLTPDQLAELKRQQLQALNEDLLRRMSSVFNEAELKSFIEAQLERQGGG